MLPHHQGLYPIKVEFDKLEPCVIPEYIIHPLRGLPHRTQQLRDGDFCSGPRRQTLGIGQS